MIFPEILSERRTELFCTEAVLILITALIFPAAAVASSDKSKDADKGGSSYHGWSLMRPVYELQKEVVRLEGEVAKLSPPLQKLEPGAIGLSRQMASIEAQTQKLFGNLHTAHKDVAELDSRMIGLGNTLKDLDIRLARVKAPVDRLSDSVTLMEQKVSELQPSIVALKKPVNSLQEPIRALRHPIEKLYTPVERLYQPVLAVRGDLSALSKRFNRLDQHFLDLDGRFGDLDKRFADLDERFKDMDNRFEVLGNQLQSLQGLLGTVVILISSICVALVVLPALSFLAAIFWRNRSRHSGSDSAGSGSRTKVAEGESLSRR